MMKEKPTTAISKLRFSVQTFLVSLFGEALPAEFSAMLFRAGNTTPAATEITATNKPVTK